jgi:hypothetical protein
MKKHTVIDR